MDSTFEFEKRRNRPVRYNRELVGTTLQAMKRVTEIQTARAERFWEKRMQAARSMQFQQAQREVASNVDIIGVKDKQRLALEGLDTERLADKAKTFMREHAK